MSDVLLGTDIYPQRLLKSKQLMVRALDRRTLTIGISNHNTTLTLT